ncbi:MAG: class I SAM-dependent methyltransferase [Planctomycetota bacterium]|jgi:ubiquinone/menaquinone biosynthesis C-methylase UbiE
MLDRVKNQTKIIIRKVAPSYGRYFNWLRRRVGVSPQESAKYDLSRRPGKFSEREIEYAFLFNNLHLSPGYRCLDVGSGRSGLALVLAHSGYSVTAIDLNPEHSWITKGDATKLSFNDSSFDVVIAISSIEHIPNSDRAIDDILRVIIPGGLIILSFPYNPTKYVKDAYKHAYKQHQAYICSIFNDNIFKKWFENKAEIVAVNYWRQYSGVLFLEGAKNRRASVVSKEEAQGICIALQKI